jgi:hypothetical protein
MITYQFKYHDPHQCEGLSPDQLLRLEHIDRLRDDRLVDHDPSYLQSLSNEELSVLVSMLPKPRTTEPAAPVPYAVPVIKQRTVSTCKTQKAALWFKDRMVTLGWFSNEQARDEAVTMAKAMRSLGLPLEAIREAVQRMTK